MSTQSCRNLLPISQRPLNEWAPPDRIAVARAQVVECHWLHAGLGKCFGRVTADISCSARDQNSHRNRLHLRFRMSAGEPLLEKAVTAPPRTRVASRHSCLKGL